MLDRLAIFGAEPAFSETLHVGRPVVGDRKRLMERIEGALDRLWLTNFGPLNSEFERRIENLLGVKHCVSMSNGTVALEIAARALGLTGEVIVPSFTFIATAHALQWQEITPVFCDIDPKTHNLDPNRVEDMITPRTTGIVGVHVWGRTCDAEALSQIARRRGLRLMFDAAHAFACSHKGEMVGGLGDVEVFSFHATKFMSTFEGGAVVTNDTDLALKIQLMSNFGFVGHERVDYVGTNGKLNEIAAAMGLTSLDSLDEIIDHNRLNYLAYRDALAGIPGLRLAEYEDNERRNYQYIVVEVDEDAAGLSRDHLVNVLHWENVRARRYFYPGCHQMEPYRSLYPHAGLLLPHTEALARKVMVLPTGTAVSPAVAKQICEILRLTTAQPGAVRDQLARVGPAPDRKADGTYAIPPVTA